MIHQLNEKCWEVTHVLHLNIGTILPIRSGNHKTFVRLALSHLESQAIDWMEKLRLALKTVLIGWLLTPHHIDPDFRFLSFQVH